MPATTGTAFTDIRGRAWELRLDVATIRRVRSVTQIDLLNLQDKDTLYRLMYEPMTIAAVLWAVCEPKARQDGISEEEFAAGLGGDCLVAAVDTLLEAIKGFFRPSQRAVLTAALERLREAEASECVRISREIAEAPLQTLGSWSSASPASPASIPPR